MSDDNSDDNGDDSKHLSYATYNPKMHLLCLVTTSARSWQCGGHASFSSAPCPPRRSNCVLLTFKIGPARLA
jgi:hypothetical protein